MLPYRPYKRDTIDWLEEIALFAAVAAGSVVAAGVVLLFLAVSVDALGYALGLWSAPCALDRGQPHCIAHGWGTGVAIRGSLHR